MNYADEDNKLRLWLLAGNYIISDDGEPPRYFSPQDAARNDAHHRELLVAVAGKLEKREALSDLEAATAAIALRVLADMRAEKPAGGNKPRTFSHAEVVQLFLWHREKGDTDREALNKVLQRVEDTVRDGEGEALEAAVRKVLREAGVTVSTKGSARRRN